MKLHPILLLTLATAVAAIPTAEENKPNNDVLQQRGNVHATWFPIDGDRSSSDDADEGDGDDILQARGNVHATSFSFEANPDADTDAATSSSPNGGTLTSRAGSHRWNAKGGCKRDWGGRCLNTCKSEARKKGYTCDKVKDQIWKEDCWLGWCVCTCHCIKY